MRKLTSLYLVVAFFYLTANYLDTCLGQIITYTLDDYPSKNYKSITLNTNNLDSSIILKASTTTYPIDGRYSFTVNVPSSVFESYRIYGTVQYFRIRNSDRLQITRTSDSSSSVVYDSKYFGTIPNSFYEDISYNRAIKFELKLEGQARLEGFDITLTIARYCPWSWDRRSNEFYCSNSYCIKDNWKCNSRNNCGNNNDESTTTCSKTYVIGFSIGGVLLFVALVVGCVVICRRRYSSPTTLTRGAIIVPPQGNIYPGTQVNVPNPVPPGTYLYNTNQANWQQFPDQTGTDPYRVPPPPYPEMNNPNFPRNQQRY